VHLKFSLLIRGRFTFRGRFQRQVYFREADFIFFRQISEADLFWRQSGIEADSFLGADFRGRFILEAE
jgi:hypothetical protein